jgi:MFS family permease
VGHDGGITQRLVDLRKPLATRDFRLVWTAQVASELGDWAARLALTVLVVQRSGSALLAGLVTTMSLLPWVGPGQVLAALGDRFTRRTILIAADIVRAAVFVAMLAPVGMPVLLGLTLAAGLATPPARAAKSALLPEILPADHYGDGLAVMQLTAQLALCGGYLFGGGLVAVIGASGAILVNAATFLVSAVAVTGLRGGRTRRSPRPVGTQLGDGARTLLRDGLLLRAALLIAIGSIGATAAEALVAVYVRDLLGGSAVLVGLLSAVVPAGTMAGVALVRRRGDHQRLLHSAAWIVAGGSVVAAAGFAVQPGLPWVIAPYLAVGLVFASIVPANTVVGQRIPDQHRASAYGLLLGSLAACQALGAAAGGWLTLTMGIGPALTLALLPGPVYAAFTLSKPPPKQPGAHTLDVARAPKPTPTR